MTVPAEADVAALVPDGGRIVEAAAGSDWWADLLGPVRDRDVLDQRLSARAEAERIRRELLS